MRKYILFIVFLLLIPIYLYATDGVSGVNHPAKVNSVATPDKVCGVSGLAGAAEHCSGISWNTFASFALDFDNETAEQACESAGDGETGVLTNATVATPGLVSPGSGGDALLCDGDTHYIDFDNSTPFFRSVYGELMAKILVTVATTAEDIVIQIQQVAYQDRLQTYVAATGIIYCRWEDNDSGAVEVSGPDTDLYIGDWIQIHIKWDTTRCTQGDGNCGDANEDEFCMRYRVDDNRDGDFGDGGAEDWSAWTCEASTLDLEVWSAEPTTDDFLFGIVGATHSQTIYVDDIEISYAQPSW